MTPELALTLSFVLPLGATILIGLCDKAPNLREAVTLGTAVALFGITLCILQMINAGQEVGLHVIDVMPGLALTFNVEPLGMMFAMVASGLWIINSLYSIGYMRGNKEKNQTRFFMCFPIAIAGALGVAYAGNLLTLFIAYEVLTLSTYPLVAHKQNDDAKRGARVYLGILMLTSICLLLPAIIWTNYAAGTMEFAQGGILRDTIEVGLVPLLLALYMFGIGKAALMPFHRWLPNAMVAPTPVSALLHAVAVVKAGVFCVLKIGIYVFGIDFLAETGATNWLQWIAAFTLVMASVIAISKDNLKARLAYSTISQLAYVVLGLSLASAAGVMGGALQIPMHAMGKITLFFCAGAIYVAAHKTEISDMDGLGRVMPITFAAFLIGALSIIGLPPMGGSWAKYYLMLGAVEADKAILMGVLLVSSLLNIAYLLPIPARGFFMKPPQDWSDEDRVSGHVSRMSRAGIKEAPAFMLVPLSFTALGTLVLFFTADHITAFLQPVIAP